jgi:hypothetical protein
MVRAQAPRATIALITVFTTHRHRSGHRYAPPAAYRTDHAIVSAARAADPHVIIMDPLASRWTFARSLGGLHPTTDGSHWIAGKVETVLHSHGFTAPGDAAADHDRPLLCDAGIPAELLRPPVVLVGHWSRASRPAVRP